MGDKLKGRPNILHLDHTVANGGAEFALVRMVSSATIWKPTVMLPRGPELGVFTRLKDASGVMILQKGARQVSGASKSGGTLLRIINFAPRILAQAVSLRLSDEFRKADLIHANTSRSALYAAIACLASKKSLVVHLRDMVSIESLGQVGHRAFTRIALRRANGIIANSSSTLKTASAYLNADALVEVIASPSGVEVIEELGSINPMVRRVGILARIDPWKGQDLLIRAFARSFQGRGVELLIAGDAPFGNEPFLHQLKVLSEELGVGDQVKFVGHVADVSGFIDTLDVCVQCSIKPEPLGQNVLQYLARGKAVIVADEGGPSEWVKHDENGLQFKARSVGSLSDALSKLEQSVCVRQELSKAALSTPGLASDSDVSAYHGALFQRVIDRHSSH